MISFF